MILNDLQQQIKNAIDNQSPNIARHLSKQLETEIDVVPDVFEGMVANQLYIELETVLLPEILRLSQKIPCKTPVMISKLWYAIYAGSFKGRWLSFPDEVMSMGTWKKLQKDCTIYKHIFIYYVF